MVLEVVLYFTVYANICYVSNVLCATGTNPFCERFVALGYCCVTPPGSAPSNSWHRGTFVLSHRGSAALSHQAAHHSVRGTEPPG